MLRKPTQSSAYAATPCAMPGTAAVAGRAVVGESDAGGVHGRSARRTAATDASWNSVSASWLSGTQPRPRRNSRSAESPSTAATAGFPSPA